MLKVAVIGCGRIADAHVSQIQRIQGCEIVGVCDRELLMAEQLLLDKDFAEADLLGSGHRSLMPTIGS